MKKIIAIIFIAASAASCSKFVDTKAPDSSVDASKVFEKDNSAIAAVDRLKRRGANNILFLCLLAAPEGIERFTEAHPDVPVVTASIDRGLNEKGYIMPGLGDAGDRTYGTK